MTTNNHASVVLQRRIPTLRRQLLERRRELLVRVARTDDDLRWLDSNLETEWQEEAQEATLARLLTALDELERTDGRYGLITMCAAGGMAPAVIIERVEG